MMLCPWNLHRAVLLLSLCLQLQCHLPATAALSLGGKAHSHEVFPKTQAVPPSEGQAHSLPETGPDPATHKDSQDDLFQDVDPKALAAVLLQALHLEPAKPNESHLDLESSANEEKVRSETKSSDVQPEREQGWKARKEGGQFLEEENPEQQEMETLKSMLQELQQYSPMAKREEQAQDQRAAASAPPGSARSEVLQELEEYEQLRVHTKRKAPPSEPWEGARKLRQQQHLEHQLLQRRYEELAESRRQAEEARRAAAEEERLADMASDLLLQYLLKDGEDSDEGERQVANGRAGSEERSRKGASLLFEDEEGNVAEDKRSNEAPEEEEEEEEEEDDGDIDPNTIDRLIELSSKLHLPADDVIDIINDVEKKKKEEMPEPFSKSKAPVPPSWDKPKKSPSYPTYSLGPKPIPKPYYPPAHQPSRPLPKEDEEAWNEVLRGDEYPATKWYPAKPNNIISNYINPRTFQPPAYRPRYPHLQSPMVPRDEYYDDRQAHNEELENYIEKVLLKHPKGF